MGAYLSIVVPTRDRAGLSARFLSDLGLSLAQTDGDSEIIIVDDGSRPGELESWKRAVKKHGAARVTLIQESKRGPAAARNTGIRRAAGEVILFLGDDIMATPELVARHVSFHRRHPSPWAALLGRITWHPGLAVTPFMTWLENGGPQFSYGKLTASSPVPFTFFYGSNISLKRRFLMEKGLFDEDFPHAALEDLELGRRLAAQGLTIGYDPDALAYHWHPVDVRASMRRMLLVGKSLRIYEMKTGAREPAYRRLSPWREFAGEIVFQAAAGVAMAVEKFAAPRPLLGRLMDRARRKGYLAED